MYERFSVGRHQIGGRCLAVVARFDIKIDTLAFAQGVEPGASYGIHMDEHVLGPIFWLDEAVALGWVEPLNCSCWHRNSR